MTDRPKRTGVSLKWFLIITTVLGAGGGTLYRLLITDPNTFQGFVGIMSGPVAVTMLLATAIRSAWKRAPERDYRALRWIGVAVAMPLLGLMAMWLSFPNGRVYAPVSTASLIANHVSLDGYQAWNELEHRMALGQLTSEHIDALLEVVAEEFEQQRQVRGRLRLPWGEDLIGDPKVAELASDEVLIKLASVVYHPTVDVGRSFGDKDVIEVAVRAPQAGPFTTLPLDACWEVVGFTAEGEPVQYMALPTMPSTRPGGEVFSLDRQPEVVRVEVRVDVFRGSQKLDGWDSLPRSSRATDPDEKPLKTWTLTAEAKAPGN